MKKLIKKILKSLIFKNDFSNLDVLVLLTLLLFTFIPCKTVGWIFYILFVVWIFFSDIINSFLQKWHNKTFK